MMSDCVAQVELADGDVGLHYFKFKKFKAVSEDSDNLDECDFGDDEDLEE